MDSARFCAMIVAGIKYKVIQVKITSEYDAFFNSGVSMSRRVSARPLIGRVAKDDAGLKLQPHSARATGFSLNRMTLDKTLHWALSKSWAQTHLKVL